MRRIVYYLGFPVILFVVIAAAVISLTTYAHVLGTNQAKLSVSGAIGSDSQKAILRLPNATTCPDCKPVLYMDAWAVRFAPDLSSRDPEIRANEGYETKSGTACDLLRDLKETPSVIVSASELDTDRVVLTVRGKNTRYYLYQKSFGYLASLTRGSAPDTPACNK